MKATAFIYELKNTKGKSKTYLIRKIFGYKDVSNHGKYRYERKGSLTPYIAEKWGRSVIITRRAHSPSVEAVLAKNKIPYKKRKIELID